VIKGGCQISMGVYSYIEKDILTLHATLLSLDGKNIINEQISGNRYNPEQIGIDLGNKFLNNPKYYINSIQKFVMKKPELINLLRMNDIYPKTNLFNIMKDINLKSRLLSSKSSINENNNENDLYLDNTTTNHNNHNNNNNNNNKIDASTSTPIHFITKNLDINYEWNEWSLRRKALKLVNLKKCVTVSSQTLNSHYRSNISTQFYKLSSKNINTLITKSTNTNKIFQYYQNIRNLNNNNKLNIIKYNYKI